MLRRELMAACFAAACCVAGIEFASAAGAPSFGSPITAEPLSRDYAVAPNGTALAVGQGTVEQGREVYAKKCASCHGANLEGTKAIGAPALVGGRGTLTSAKPAKTVESYWPYATTLFDYTRRAMPFNAPGSLTNDEVYGVTAYILAKGRIIEPAATMDATRLRNVRMPNVDGFIADPR